MNINTKEEARSYAINFQNTFNEFNYSFSELIEKLNYIEKIGKKFNLLEELKENGIL